MPDTNELFISVLELRSMCLHYDSLFYPNCDGFKNANWKVPKTTSFCYNLIVIQASVWPSTESKSGTRGKKVFSNNAFDLSNFCQQLPKVWAGLIFTCYCFFPFPSGMEGTSRLMRDLGGGGEEPNCANSIIQLNPCFLKLCRTLNTSEDMLAATLRFKTCIGLIITQKAGSRWAWV